MIKNVWAINDLATSALFIGVIILKIYDIASFQVIDPNVCPATVNVTQFITETGIKDFKVRVGI